MTATLTESPRTTAAAAAAAAPAPAPATTVTPHLTCRDAAGAIEFYKRAFGAEEACVIRCPDGGIMHAAVSIGGAQVFLRNECPEFGSRSPQGLGGSPVTLHLQVADCDAVFDRAVAEGCAVRMPLADMFWGDRYGVLQDPYGHAWSVATSVRHVSPEELAKGAAACGEQMKKELERCGAAAR